MTKMNIKTPRQRLEEDLTPKQEKFATLYAEYRRPADAYRRSYNAENMKPCSVYHAANELLRNPNVAKRIDELRKKAAEKNEFNAADVLKQWLLIATADPAELIKSRRLCCRYCHGVDNEYQWIDASEYAKEVALAIDKKKPSPSMAGGFGFLFNKPPHPECKHCAGEGVEDIYITPTDQLSSQGKLLYSGLRKSREGVQVLMRDQDDALRNIARFLGMTSQEIKLSTAENKPLDVSISSITTDQNHAAKIYQEYVKGN